MVYMPVPKSSSRRGQRVRLVVLHTTEGARTVESLAAFLRKPGVNASYHGAVDDHKYAAFVNYSEMAWALRGGNPMSDNLCLCAFAGWSRAEWLKHPRMLELTAAWIAERCTARKLPIDLLSIPQTRAAVREPGHPGGVADHHRYTQATKDGTHWDVGPNFPFDLVMSRAREIARIAPLPRTAGAVEAVAPKVKPKRMVDEMPAGSLPPGKHVVKLVMPIGKASALVAKGWLSLASSEAGTARVWAQGASGGTGKWDPVTLAKDRRWSVALPDGTDQITVHTDSKGSVGWCLELQPK